MTNKFGKLNKTEIRLLAAIIVGVIVLIIPITNTYQKMNHSIDIQRERFSSLVDKCISADLEKKVLVTGRFRSIERLTAVGEFFSSIVTAPCIRTDGKHIRENPYKGINLQKGESKSPTSAESEIWGGIAYDYDYGIFVFQPQGGSLCDDNSYSPSVGRGTCSHHGGYAYNHGTKMNFDSLTQILDPNRSQPLTAFGFFLGPVGLIWNSIYFGLLGHSPLLMILFGWEIFLLIPLLPLFLFGEIVKRHDGAKKAHYEIESKISESSLKNTNNEVTIKPEVTKRKSLPYKPKYSSITNEYSGFSAIAWLNSHEALAATNSVMSKTDIEVFESGKNPKAWIRVRQREMEQEGGSVYEYGLERSVRDNPSMVAWFEETEIEAMNRAFENEKDITIPNSQLSGETKVQFVSPNQADSIINEPSVRIFRKIIV